jgi:hypothetical protein
VSSSDGSGVNTLAVVATINRFSAFCDIRQFHILIQ